MNINMDPNNLPGNQNPEGDFKPWEQRTAPGAGGGGGSLSEEQPSQFVVEVKHADVLKELVDDQTRLAHYPMVNYFKPSRKDAAVSVAENAEAWSLFCAEKIYDTARVTLNHFHLFEWFPLAPGKYHALGGDRYRREALVYIRKTPAGDQFLDPYGKELMFKGGIGAVRIRPRLIEKIPYYFLSASSSGVCHEGFPVLVPRQFYAQVKPIINQLGAAPVTLSGEMRYLYQELPSFFEGQRDVPSLFLHVDHLETLSSPRANVSEFGVSAAISFVGKFEANEGVYATYATFNPADSLSLEKAINWMEKFYVTQQYKGVVVTDFDEVVPRFPGAVFGLPKMMAGKLDRKQVAKFLKGQGFSKQSGDNFFLIYKEINTQGGAYIEGDVNTRGGDFIGRDKIISPETPP
jgi:hypothetical protein